MASNIATTFNSESESRKRVFGLFCNRSLWQVRKLVFGHIINLFWGKETVIVVTERERRTVLSNLGQERAFTASLSTQRAFLSRGINLSTEL